MTKLDQAEISQDTGLFFAGAAAAATLIWPTVGQWPQAIAAYAQVHGGFDIFPDLVGGWFAYLIIPFFCGCLIGPAFFRFVKKMEEE